MTGFLRELGYSAGHYWLFAGVSFLLWLASAALPPEKRVRFRLNTSSVFAGLMLVTMFAFRWPGIFHYRSLNADESQFLAGAITVLARGDIWWPDATTSGPFVMTPLIIPGLFGLPIDFATGRTIGMLLTWGTCVLTYLTLRHVHGDRLARLLVLPLASLMVILLFWDFVPYCSELCPLFFCSLAVWFGVTAFRTDGTLEKYWRFGASGAVLGLLPFSKIQAVPLGAAIGVALMLWAFRQPARDFRSRARDGIGMGVAAGLSGGLILAVLWGKGRLEDVFRSYILHSFDYAQARHIPWADSTYTLRYLTDFSWGFTSFHVSLLILLVIGLAGMRRVHWRPLVLAWLLLVAAYYAVVAPGRLYPHYLILLTAPLGLLVGLQYGFLIRLVEGRPLRRAVLASLFLVLGVGAQFADRVYDRHSLKKLLPVENLRAPLVTTVLKAKRPGDSLTVWGWRPEFHVETQLPQGTREAHTAGQVHVGPQRDYFRARFLSDVRTNRPAFFIDAVGSDGFNFRDRATQGHETFAALADFIQREYMLTHGDGAYRLYLRRDRIGIP